MTDKFDEVNHKFGMAYLAYKKPYSAGVIYPEEVKQLFDGDEPLYAARFSMDAWYWFIDMTRLPEKDYIPVNSQYIMDTGIDPNKIKGSVDDIQ